MYMYIRVCGKKNDYLSPKRRRSPERLVDRVVNGSDRNSERPTVYRGNSNAKQQYNSVVSSSTLRKISRTVRLYIIIYNISYGS